MNQKEVELLRILLSQRAPMRGKDLADVLKISPRSVKNYVRSINDSFDQRVVFSSRAGYSVNPQTASLVTLEDRQMSDALPQTTQERIVYILRRLIGSHNKGLDLFELSDELFIGYSTVRSLITRMNSSFDPYRVRFVTHNDVLMMEGCEQDKRRFICTVIDEGLASSITRVETLDAYFENVDIRTLRRIVQETFGRHHYYLNDFSELNLVMHIAIIVDRSISGQQLTSGSTEMAPSGEREEALLLDLFGAIEDTFDVRLNDYERGELFLLAKSNANLGLMSLEDDYAELVGQDIVELTDEIVLEVWSQFLVDLSSEAFKVSFASHLKNLLFRALHGRTVKNPLAKSVKSGYPVVFDMAVFVALNLMHRYGIEVSESETALIAIHIGAEIERQNVSQSKVKAVFLCPAYLDLVSRVMNELLLNFGNRLDIVHVLRSQMELQELVDRKAEMSLVLTTVHLSMPAPCRILHISPISIQQQMGEISGLLMDILEEQRAEELRMNFSSYCEKELFTLGDNMRTRDEALTRLCGMLKSKGYVSPSFERDVRDRELAASTGFGSLAIPHSAHMDAIKTSIAIMVAPGGIEWGDTVVHLVLLMTISKMDRQLFRVLYESLISLFSDERVIVRTQQCATYQEFEQLVRSMV